VIESIVDFNGFCTKFYCNFILHMHSIAYSSFSVLHYTTKVVVLQTLEERI